MAGWISQTRKMISAVASSLADDLEQAVQELNDVVYRLGSTHEDMSSSQAETRPDNTTQDERHHFEQTSGHGLSATFQEPRPNGQHQAFVSSELLRATQTTQPETSGCSSTLNAGLSLSTPALYICEDTISVAKDKCGGTWRLALQSPIYSLISSSSPCLTDRPVTPAQSSDRASMVNSEHCFRHPHLCSKTLKQTIAPASLKVCPYHIQDSIKITRGMKHPGRVVRAQSLITQEQGRPPAKEDPPRLSAMEEHNHSFSQPSCTQIPGGTPDLSLDSPTCDASDVEDGEPGSQQAGEASSSLVPEEHHTSLLRWASLRPLTRMLSLAFAQLANAALIFSDISHSVHGLTSSPGTLGTESKLHEVTGAMYPLGIGEHGHMETRCERHASQRQVQQSSMLQHTCSTDSFEVIESAWPAGAVQGDQRMISECQAPQAHSRLGEAAVDRLDISSSYFSCAHPGDGGAALPDMSTSSTDFVCFDFRKLLTEDQFRGDNSVLESRGSPEVNSCSIESDFLVVRGDCLNQSVSGQSVSGQSVSGQSVSGDSSSSCQHSCHHDTGRDNANDGDGEDDDDDGDSNESFIILSDNDISHS